MPLSDPCSGSNTFPDNFDGEFTKCGECGRTMNLSPGGRVPSHNRVAKKGYLPRTVATGAFPDLKREADE